MKSVAAARKKGDLAEAFDEVLAIEPSALVLFAAPSILRDEEAVDLIRKRIAGSVVIGCSTSGEISGQGLLEDGLSLIGFHFDTGGVRAASRQLVSARDSFAVGQALGEELKAPDLKAVFVLAPGTQVNGSALADGLNACLGRNVIISGGLAGDGMAFKQTTTLCCDGFFPDRVVAIGLYGEKIVVSCGSEGGWRPFGPARRVTKSDGNLLYELDGKPALQLYKQYLGEKASQLPASGISYPFAILRSDRTTSGLIRSALDVDQENEVLIMAGDIPQGCQVCLMHADTGALIQGAAQAAAEALRTHAGPEEGGCALVVNCVGRKMVLGIDADEEIEAVVDSFLPGTPLAGYYSYGEICSYGSTGRTELHNQTMTITYINERREG